MLICIAGWTAAGKTTHAMRIAHEFEMEYISATEIFKEHLGITSANSIWAEGLEKIGGLRDTLPLDQLVDNRLVELASVKKHAIFDSWALPWITKSKMISIWLDSDLHSRVMKAQVCALGTPFEGKGYQWFEELLTTKDCDSATRFKHIHGFDYGFDSNVFDIALDNSKYIVEPTEESSAEGIERFHTQLRSALNGHILAEPRE